MLRVGERGFDGVDDVEPRDDLTAGVGHSLGGRIGALRFDDVAVRLGSPQRPATSGRLDVAVEHDTQQHRDGRSQDSNGSITNT